MQQHENHMPIKSITEAVAYFLAGSFTIGTIISSSIEVPEAIYWLIIIVSGILILSGFALLVTILPFKWLNSYRTTFQKITKYLFAGLFAITTSQIVQVLIFFKEIQPLFIITLIFLILVIFSIIISSVRIFLNVSTLVSLSFVYTAYTLLLVINEAPKIQIITLLVICVIVLFWTVLRISQHEKSKGETSEED